jgi:protein-S-isoprenylcysteine O-methyltransferase Ste14
MSRRSLPTPAPLRQVDAVTVTVSKILWLICGIIWFALRISPERRSRKTPIQQSRRDTQEIVVRGVSRTGLGMVPYAYLATGFPRFAEYPFHPAQGWLGVATYICVYWLFYRTHLELGRNWSVSLDVRERHTLITTGVYARVRHPMYSGFWLMAVAQALMLPNWVAGPAGLVGFGALFFGRVFREEEMMIGAFGDEYREYMRRTARIIPWLY